MNSTLHGVAPEEVMAWLDGELTVAEAQAVAAHLEECADCAALAEELRATARSLAAWSVPEAPSRLDAAVKERGAAVLAGRRTRRAKASIRVSVWNWRVWAIAGGGAASVVLILLAVVLSSSYRARHLTYSYQASAPAEMGVDEMVNPAPPPPQPSEPAAGDRIVSEQRVQEMPIKGKSFGVARMEQGAVAASHGLMHGLGDHAANSFSVDGQNLSTASVPMIARTVSLVILVKDFTASRTALDAILARHRGYAAQLTASTPEDAPRGFQASLRIPATELPASLADLKALGRVLNETQSGEEVSEQHADLVARLKNSREEETRLQAILEQRTGKIEDVLQVEEKIADVRGEIESMEAQQQALEHRVDFASVELQLTEQYRARLGTPDTSPLTRMRNALVAGFHHAAATVLGFVLFAEEYGPVMLIWLVLLGAPALFLWRRIRRARARL